MPDMLFGQGTRLYRILPNRKDAFLAFYKANIIPWLTESGETKGSVWTAEDSKAFLFFFSSYPTDPPWSGSATPGLEEFFAPIDTHLGAFTAVERDDLGFPV